ncbi:hypothetical protein ASE63_23550 [Bosea sp. Root381]|nr:hypothetical protein ASE63_23550 [Bosea sp. Root381]
MVGILGLWYGPLWPMSRRDGDQARVSVNMRASRVPRTTAKSLLPYLIAAALAFPSLVWVLLDNSAFGGDQSAYGIATLDLFHTLTHAPRGWPVKILDVYPYKPNGLIWLGQAFLPLAFIIPSVNTALLLTNVAVQAVTIVLVYRALFSLSSSVSLATTACLVIASAPMFILFAHHYLVESLQTMAVAWFVLIMCRAPAWNRSLLLPQLVAATAVALASKQIQPLFCVWPGLVACIYLLRSPRPPDPTQRGLTIASWTLAIPMAALTAAWYLRNLDTVLEHLRAGAFGEGYGAAVKTMWGREDGYLSALTFWMQVGQDKFLPGLAGISLALLLIAMALYLVRGKRTPSHFSLCAGVAALQILTVVMVFSLSPLRQDRYLLPVLPYVALIVGWSLAQINRSWATAAACAIFAMQFVLLHGKELKLMPARAGDLSLAQRVDTDSILSSIVARTCPTSSEGPIRNTIAIEPSIPEIAGDWLAPVPANYVVARDRFRSTRSPLCHYDYLGGFYGTELSEAWDALLAQRTQNVVVIDPTKYSTPAQVFNQTLSRENLPRVMHKLETSGFYEKQPPLTEDPGILIFRRTEYARTPSEHMTKARELSSQGLYEQALQEIQQATVKAPSNVEAWANLAAIYAQAGAFRDAISAGVRAREIDPRHYYVNLGLARASFHLEDWRKAIGYAMDAASDAPSKVERAGAWELAAKAAFRAGDTKGGCDLLEQVLTATNIASPEAVSHGCTK